MTPESRSDVLKVAAMLIGSIVAIFVAVELDRPAFSLLMVVVLVASLTAPAVRARKAPRGR